MLEPRATKHRPLHAIGKLTAREARLLAAFCVIVLLLGAAACSADSESRPNGGTTGAGREQSDPGLIAFWSNRVDPLAIFVMRPDGTEVRALTAAPLLGDDTDPTWSPDGSRVAFVRSYENSYDPRERRCRDADPLDICAEIWAITVDGLDEAQLSPTMNAGAPAWSPDGTQITFHGRPSADYPGDTDIYVMPEAGGSTRPLTNSPADEQDPHWSPDGTQIVYSSFGSRNRDSPDIWVMNSDGSGQRALTSDPYYDYRPAWSPDGKQIAFQRQYPASDQYTINNELVVINVDGTGFQRLTKTRSAAEEVPAWSPDGREIVFVSDQHGADEIFLMNADGTDVRKLTEHDDTVSDYDPVWWAPMASR